MKGISVFLLFLIYWVSNSTSFAAVPVISAISPASGAAGTLITITGVDLGNALSIKFGAVPAHIITNTNTQITLKVPIVASASKISITTAGGTVLSSSQYIVSRSSTIKTYKLQTKLFNSISKLSAAPLIADLDGDGLLDLLVGGADGTISHYKQSVSNDLSFTIVDANFNNIDVGTNSVPSLTDIDDNGKLDLIIGAGNGSLTRYEQSGVSSLIFSLVANNFAAIAVGSNAKPAFADLDNDGKIDMLIGAGNGTIAHYAQSNPSSSFFSLVQLTFNGINTGGNAAPLVSDIDGDNRLDLLVGDSNGRISHYTAASASSTTYNIVETSFSDIYVGNNTIPAISDLNEDGIMDLLIGNSGNNLIHYIQAPPPVITTLSPNSGNVGTTVTITGTDISGITSVLFNSVPAAILTNSDSEITFKVPPGASTGYIKLSASNGIVRSNTFTVTHKSKKLNFDLRSNDFNGINKPYAKPLLVDIDKDGLMDLLVGGSNGTIDHYEQTAAGSTLFTLDNTYYNNVNVISYSAPAITDLDGDGLLDLIIGDGNGQLTRFEQSYTNYNAFNLVVTNFGQINVGNNAKPAFADLDGDGLLDLIVGEQDGNLNHYEQRFSNGTSFALVNAFFNNINVGANSSPEFIDLDGDGLLNLLIGNDTGHLNYFGQAAVNSTNFNLITSNFNNITAGENAAPFVSDIDADGWLDMLIGTKGANIIYYEQYMPPPDIAVSIVPGNTKNTITWEANLKPDMAVSYKIYGGTSPDPTSVIQTQAAGSYEFQHMGLTNGQMYYYRITSIDMAGDESDFSEEVYAMPNANQGIIILQPIPNKVFGDQAFDIIGTAYADSGLPVTYSIKNGPATLSGSLLTIHGAGIITVAINQAGNHSFTPALEKEISFTVIRGTPIVEWLKPASITYATPLNGTQLNAKADIAGTFFYDQAFGTILNAGNQLLTARFVPFDSINYTSIIKTVDITVNKAELRIIADSKIRCYGEEDPLFTLSYSGFVNGDDPSVLISPMVSTTANKTSLAGSYPILLTGGKAVNYNLILVNGNLTIQLPPVIKIRSSLGNAISKGQSTVLNAISEGKFFLWSNASGIIGGQNTPDLTVMPQQTTTYTVTVTNALGCSSTDSITIVVDANLVGVSPTNLITPNGDGINDYWIIRNIDMYPDNEVKVFDKTGRIVYNTKSYKNDWNGNLNGFALEEDTYYFVISIINGFAALKGFITIIRD